MTQAPLSMTTELPVAPLVKAHWSTCSSFVSFFFIRLFITSVKEVMCLLCLFVCLLAGLRKNYLADFHIIIRWKGGTRPRKNRLNFGGNPDQATAGLGLRLTFDVTPGMTPRLRNDLYCVEWDVKLYCTITGRTLCYG